MGAFGYLTKLGSAGSGDGQFNQAWGIATDGAGQVYVADTLNHRIQKFNASGTFLTKWGTLGSADGQFNHPYDVATDVSGNVYVADGFNGRVQKFDAAGTFLTKWQGDGGFFDARDLATDPSGYIYVANAGNNNVQKFDSSGNFLTKWGNLGQGPGQFNQLSGIAADAGGVYTLESGNRRIQKFTSTGAFVSSWNISNAVTSSALNSIDIDASGNVYVLDAGVMRRFTPSGVTGQFACGSMSQGVATDNSGNVYVSGDDVLKFGEGGTVCPGTGGGSPGESPGETSGVTINDGALFTNDPDVTLTIAAPSWATRALISNDGGFGRAKERSINGSDLAWRLRSSGPERLPKIVYVRFASAGGASSQIFTDDIILDETRPKLLSVTLVSEGTAAVKTAGQRTYRLRLSARDRTSGIKRMQITSSRRRPGKLKRYRRHARFKSSKSTIYVRVRDGAGNFSRWRKAR